MAKVCKKVIREDFSGVDFIFATDPPTTRTVVFADQSPAMQTRLQLFGITEKYGNSYSGSAGDPAVALKSFDECNNQIGKDEWASPRGEGMGTVPSLLVEAFLRFGKSENAEYELDDAREAVGALKKKQKTALRGNPTIAALISEVKIERETVKRAKMTQTSTPDDDDALIDMLQTKDESNPSEPAASEETAPVE